MSSTDEDIRAKIAQESKFSSGNRDKKELISLSGFAVTKGGKLTRSEYFDFLNANLDSYSDIVMSSERARKVFTHLTRLKTGSAAMVPLYCGGGVACPWATRCPLVQARDDLKNMTEEEKKNSGIDPIHGLAPLGKACLIESEMLTSYMVRLMEEYDVDPQNFTEIGFINELAEIEVYLYRLNMMLALPENATLVVDQSVGVSRDGEPIIQKQISPFMDQREKLLSRKSRVIKLMVGDREGKYKKQAALKENKGDDPSNVQANAKRVFETMRRKMEEIELEKKKDVSTIKKNLPKVYGEDVLTPEDIFNQEE